MMQTLDRSIYEKTGAKNYRQKWRTKRRYLSVFCRFHRFCMYEALVFVGIVEIIRS